MIFITVGISLPADPDMKKKRTLEPPLDPPTAKR